MKYAYLTPSTVITLATGVVQMYRLPTMMPGLFHLYSHQVGVSTFLPTQPSSSVPGGPILGPVVMRMIRSGASGLTTAHGPVEVPPFPPLGGGGGGGTVGIIANLKMDLYHGDELIVSGANTLPLQENISDGDDTWRVQLQIDAGAPEATYAFNVILNPYPSDFPQLTRRIPLAFLQQGFDNNWKGRRYISLEFMDNALVIIFDPEVASYYGLSNVQYVLASIPLVTFPNIQVSDISLSVDSSDGPYEGWPAPLPYILLSVKFTGVNGKPIIARIPGYSASADEFTVNVKLFLIPVGSDVTSSCVGYVSQVATDLISRLNVSGAASGVVKKQIREKLDGFVAEAQGFLDNSAFAVGTAVTPWLLGAAFAVVNVRYDPANSQPVPPGGPQGDLVIDYIAQRPPPSSGMTAMSLKRAGGSLTLDLDTAPAGVAGTVYEETFAASGGQPPYTWAITGSLPPGLAASGAALSGTPTSSGAYTVSVTVRDSAATQVVKSYMIAVNPPELSIETASILPDAILTQPYAVQFSVQDTATQTYTWSAGTLPAGLTLLAQGVIQGTPTGVSGPTSFALRLTGSGGQSASKVFSLALQDPELFPVIYAPRGDADTYWKPYVAPSNAQAGVPHPLSPATTRGNLGKVDHIVLVMMENRSFDHMLGYLSREGGRADIEGLKWESSTHSTQYNFYKGQYYYPYVLTDTQIIKSERIGPDHSHESVKGQICDGMKHFVADYAERKVGNDPDQLKVVMGYYTSAQLPVYDMLAREYAVCDHWFCSHPGPTWPNRFVAMTGDLNRDSYGEPEVNTPQYSDFTPSEALTIFDHLSARGVSWKYFQQRESMMRAFTKYSFDMVDVLEYSDAAHGFHATVCNGALPSFTWVDPLFGDLPAGVGSPQDNDDAPPSDLRFGQLFIQDVYNTLFSPGRNPHWAKTMLIVVYDEHGGFYDHVDPPTNATALIGQNSGKLGPRVPAFVISPFTPAGLVLKDTFDHASIAATVLRRFCSPHPPDMGARVAAARDLRSALPLKRPRGKRAVVTSTAGVNLTPQVLQRTALRRFKLPAEPDNFGSVLGGIALTLGSTPGSS